MTAARDVLRRITAAGGSIEATGEKLRVRAPKPLPDDLMATLRQHKAEVMAMLVGSDLVAARCRRAEPCRGRATYLGVRDHQLGQPPPPNCRSGKMQRMWRDY